MLEGVDVGHARILIDAQRSRHPPSEVGSHASTAARIEPTNSSHCAAIDRRHEQRPRRRAAHAVEQQVEVPLPDRLAGDLDQARDRPQERERVLGLEVGAQRAAALGRLDELAEHPPELVAHGLRRRRVPHALAEHAVVGQDAREAAHVAARSDPPRAPPARPRARSSGRARRTGARSPRSAPGARGSAGRPCRCRPRRGARRPACRAPSRGARTPRSPPRARACDCAPRRRAGRSIGCARRSRAPPPPGSSGRDRTAIVSNS